MNFFILIFYIYKVLYSYFITIVEGIINKDENDLRGKSACKWPNVTYGSVTCNTNYELSRRLCIWKK